MRPVLIVAALLVAAPGAHAATVAGQLVDGRLELRFRAAPGEQNELRILPHDSGVRFAGSAPLVAGPHCRAVREGDVRCGPPPPGGLAVHARTGDRDDFVFARVAGIAIETLRLGRGNDEARGNGYRVRANRLWLAELTVYASLSMSRLADLRLLLLLPLRGE